MKTYLSVVLTLLIVLGAVAGCGNNTVVNDLNAMDVQVGDLASDANVDTQISGDTSTDDATVLDVVTPDVYADVPDSTDEAIDGAVLDAIADLVADSVIPAGLGINPRFSDCGGFNPVRALADCGDETLAWTHDAGTGTVTFVNTNVSLNCCGLHSISITFEGGVYTMAEVDDPAAEGGRCFCTCLFDFGIELPGQSGGLLDIAITRTVTDAGDPTPRSVWAGEIDLSAGSGEVVIQENVGVCD